VPYQTVYSRWHLSLPVAANFSQSTVQMTANGTPIPLSVNPPPTKFFSLSEYYLVWNPYYPYTDGGGYPDVNDFWATWPKPTEDMVYRVTISNVLIDSKKTTISYEVIVFDPAAPDNEQYRPKTLEIYDDQGNCVDVADNCRPTPPVEGTMKALPAIYLLLKD
jgi:hypothetical protein